jgi:tRNA 2-thiouridine synthesizing protein A
MRCPWPALRAARALREHEAVLIRADDPIAPEELAAMAQERGWAFETRGESLFFIARNAPA